MATWVGIVRIGEGRGLGSARGGRLLDLGRSRGRGEDEGGRGGEGVGVVEGERKGGWGKKGHSVELGPS